MPKVRLVDGVDPASIEWPNLGYADAYQQSFEIFGKLRDEGVVPAGVRFQVQYPTPLASINGWVVAGGPGPARALVRGRVVRRP